MRLVIPVTLVAAVLLAAAALARAGGEAAYGIVWPDLKGAAHLVRIDPVTVRAQGRTAATLGQNVLGHAVSPDRSQFVFGRHDVATLRFVALPSLRMTGDVELGLGDLEWLLWPGNRIVALYRLKRATLAVVDPESRMVTRRWRFRGPIESVRAAAGRVVLLEWPVEAPGPSTLHLLEPDNRLRSVRLERIAAGVQQKAGKVVQIDQPGLAIDDTGTRAFVVDRDGEICEVALDTLAVACHPLRHTASVAKGDEVWFQRQLRWVGPDTLALSGWQKPRRGPGPAAKAIGLSLIDTRTWQRRLLDQGTDTFWFAGGTIVAQSTGKMLGFAPDGTKRYDRPVASASGIVSVAPPYLYVAREYRPSLVLDLATGRLLGTANTLKIHPLSDPDAW